MATSQKAPVKDTYRAPRVQAEYDRLSTQHELVKGLMGGKLVASPVDAKSSNIRILDSGTGQGVWIIDLAKVAAPTAVLIGTDIAPQHFAPAACLPGNVKLAVHSIYDAWPADWIGSFDLVHQRFVLGTCTEDAAAAAAVRGLFSCVRRGGWIELHEGNMHVIREGPRHKAFMRFRDMIVHSWCTIRQQTAPGTKIAAWLREAGAVDVREQVQIVRVGAEAKDKSHGDTAILVVLYMLDAFKAFFAGKPTSFFFFFFFFFFFSCHMCVCVFCAELVVADKEKNPPFLPRGWGGGGGAAKILYCQQENPGTCRRKNSTS